MVQGIGGAGVPDGHALDDSGGMLRKHCRQSVQSSRRNSHGNSPIPDRLL
jgi:hypothetical protein